MSTKIPVTVIVPIKNEALNLPTCLGALKDFQKVIVVDSGSTDDSQEIARSHGAEVVDFRWDGHFPKKRNWMLRNHKFETEWILFLDADEKVTPEFQKELATAIQDPKYNGYWVTYHNYFMGHLLRHGDAFRKLPVLRLGKGEFERIDENAWSKLDMEVHEHLEIEGGVGNLTSPIIHNDFKSLTAYYDRHNQYSSWEASRFLAMSGDQKGKLTPRQKIKYKLLNSIWFPPLYFLATYIGKKGFLDGEAGFRFAVGKAFYFYQINFKVAELRMKEKKS